MEYSQSQVFSNPPIESNSRDKESNSSSNSTCFYFPADYLIEKFILVTIFGTVTSLTSIFNNSLLVYLLTKSSLISSHVFYLAVLAICDIIIGISYILLMSAQILYDYMENLSLYYAWNNYLRPVFAISHVSLVVSVYMIVAASAERYLASASNRLKIRCVPGCRVITALTILLFSIISKGMVYWELEVVYKPNCTAFQVYHVRPSALALSPGPYKYVYMLWFRHIAHVFFPFALLICLNWGILVRLRQTAISSGSPLLGARKRETKKKVKAATKMLIATVSTYLVSNLLNVVLTVWEHLDIQSLHDQEKFYAFSADVVSLLSVITGAIRLPIYCACNKRLRRA